jgi:phenylalanyl-tRNA synthetase beta chain
VAELDLEPLVAQIGLGQAESPSVYPPVDFDLSFLIGDETPVSALLDATTNAGSGLVEASYVFDEFRGSGVGEGERAVAIRYRLRAPDRTLSNEAASPVREAMIEAARKLGAKLRGV